MFDGFFINASTLPLLSSAKSRSISAENMTGAKNAGALATAGTGEKCARDLGRGWKVSPSYAVQPGEVFTMAEIEGPGAIQSIWLTGHISRDIIIRFYWDDQDWPSVEAPVSDFFACGWGKYAQINSLAVCVNPGSAFNCYWEMPFRKSCRITMENIDENPMTLYYQIDYTLTDVPKDAAYLHAQFRRINPMPYKSVFTILEGVKGADVIYTDVWVSMGEPMEIWEQRIKELAPYQVNAKVMAAAKPTAIFMHCLPAFHDLNTTIGKEMGARFNRDSMEVSDDVFSSPQSVVFDEAENRMHTIKAVMLATL